ncbi:protein telomere ends associated-like isoform X1 [Drosophila guanche]|uniref:protein telomere ends associated-like isoform X1 n=1 Tax=Drosophila guanche TaxID=7266 RepID=UPI001471FC33|nr:protein telomere ends associated-like isoform X1 [Drosophila guanche]
MLNIVKLLIPNTEPLFFVSASHLFSFAYVNISTKNQQMGPKEKPKTKCKQVEKQPVTFQKFSQLIENLPDIAFEVQRDRAANGDADGARKTLDECASWYYHAFYKDASVRERYEFKLRACPQKIRNILLSMPEAEADESTQEFEHETADGVMVEVEKVGEIEHETADGVSVEVEKDFVFPVHFHTFQKYVDMEKIKMLMEHESTSPSTEQHQLMEFYKSFYMFPEKRKTTNIFHGSITTFMPKLLAAGHRIVESAARSLAEHNKETNTVEEPAMHQDPETRNASTCCTPDSDFSIVSFEEFQKYVLNLYDIVWKLKLNDPQYVYMGFEECAHAFYLAFYLSPEIRERCKYTLKPCTSAMSARLLAIPTPEQADKLRQNLPELIKPSPDLERPKSPELVEETVVAPVSFQFFKKYIKNLEEISEQMRSEDGFKNLSNKNCAREYFRLFYSTPEIRERFQFNLKPCPAAVREKLLSLPTSSFIADSVERAAPNEADPAVEKPTQNFPELISPSPDLERPESVEETVVAPVSFQFFKKYIKNLEEISEKMRNEDEFKTLSKENCAREYYRLFYRSPEIRERFQFKLKPCPGAVRENLLSLPSSSIIADSGETPMEEPKATNSSKISQPHPNDRSSLPFTKRAAEPPSENATLEYPVTLQCFSLNINYADMICQLRKTEEENKEKDATILSDYQLMERFYKEFYTDEGIRKKYNYNFNKATPALQLRLLRFAKRVVPSTTKGASSGVSISAIQSRTAPNEADPQISSEPVVVTVCDKSYEFPVTLRTFLKYINYKDIVGKLCNKSNCTDKQFIGRYYRSFYLDQKVRNAFAYKFSERTPPKLLEKLNAFAIPFKGDKNTDKISLTGSSIEVAISAKQSRTAPNEADPQIPSEPIVVTVCDKSYEFPVTLRTFLKYINYKDIVGKLCNKSNCTDKQFIGRYYRSFYLDQKVRNAFAYKFSERTPPKLLEKLNAFAIPFKGDKNTDNISLTRKEAEKCVEPEVQLRNNENIPPQNTISGQSTALSSANDNKSAYMLKGFRYPVTFEVFRRHINYDEIIESALRQTIKDESVLPRLIANPQDPLCIKAFDEFYRRFYIFPHIRKSLSYRFDCGGDPSLMEKLCGHAETLNENAKRWVESAKPPPAEENLITPNGIKYRYPVSFNTFCRSINVDELKVQLANHFSKNKKLKDNNCCMRQLRHYYNSFYTSRRIREMFKYNFDSATPELRAKCLQFAVPITQAREVPPEPQPEPQSEIVPQSEIEPHAEVDPQVEVEPQSEKEPQPEIETQPEIEQQPEIEPQSEMEPQPELDPSSRFASRCVESSVSVLRQNTPDIVRCHAARQAVLDVKQKLNVVHYVPHNLKAYISRHVSCLKRRAVLEKNIIETVRDLNKAAAISDPDSGMDTATKQISGEKNTEGSAVTAAIEVETEKVPGKCPAPSIEVEVATAEKPNTVTIVEQIVWTSKVPESTTSTAERVAEEPCVTDNLGTITSVPAPKEVQTKTTSEVAPSSTAETVNPEASAVNTSNQFLLKQIMGVFEAPREQEQNILYFIHQSHGLKRTIWRILSQLSLEEFCTYTSFHSVEALYDNESRLQRCHQQVVANGHWPLHLHVKLDLLRCLLHSKGVEMPSLELDQLSPKILHWKDLMLHTDFDEIVEQHYEDRTGCRIEDMELLFEERKKLYTSCWTHDQWIRQVPQISQSTEILDSTTPTPAPCVHTEFNDQSTSFVDMDEVAPASQLSDTYTDPLMESQQVKQEKIKFLDKMRGSCLNSQEVQWERIDLDDQIIRLDDSQESLSNLACFAIPKATVVPPLNAEKPPQFPESENTYLSTELAVPETQLAIVQTEEEEEVEETEPEVIVSDAEVEVKHEPEPERVPEPVPEPLPEPVPEPVSVPQQNVRQKDAPALPPSELKRRKHEMHGSNLVAFKKPRVMPEKVPQLRHEFRALPMNAVVRIESVDFNRSIEVEQPTTSMQTIPCQEKEPTVTASQDFATDNTLLASSQLDALLNAPNVTLRKVNEIVTCTDKNIGKGPPTVMQSCVIFREVEHYRFFSALTTEHITKHMIEGCVLGSAYHDALIKMNGKLCKVRGPLIETLFPHMSIRLRSDLRDILDDLGEFTFNCRRNMCKDSTQDLRVRVLSMFMDVAPTFVHFRAVFDNATGEWATCSSIDRGDPDIVRRPPRCNVGAVLKPGILERMKELKGTLR